MTVVSPTEITIAEFRNRLSASLAGSTLSLPDDLLGLPVFQSPVLTVTAAELDLSEPDAVAVHGTVDLLGATGVDLDLRVRDGEAGIEGQLRLVAAPGSPVRLSGILTTIAGPGVALPPEVPDLAFTELGFAFAPRSGAFVLEAACAAPWSLPFGGSGLAVGATTVRVERTAEAGAPVRVALRLGAAGALAVADGFQVTGFDLAFSYGAIAYGGGAWSLAGTLQADLLDHSIELAAGYTQSGETREFAFRASSESAATVDLAGAGQLTASGLSVVIAKTPTGGTRLDAASAYAWSVTAAGSANLLGGQVVLDGELTLAGEPGQLSLTLRPSGEEGAAGLSVPLGSSEIHLGLDSLTVCRFTTEAAVTWTLTAATDVWFSGLPGGLDTVLPSAADSRLTGTFEVTTGAAAGVRFAVDPVLPCQPFVLPSIEAGDFELDLSRATAAIEIGELRVGWTRAGVEVGVEFGVGIPAELNQIFGTGHDVFVTYDAGDPDSLTRFTLSASVAGGAPTLRLYPLTSPLRKLVFQPVEDGSDARQATVDLGDLGRFSLVVPTLGLQGETVRARGGFTQEDLAVPLAPLKWLTRALGIEGVNRFLPDRLPLRDLNIYDEATGLDVDALFDTLMSPLRTVPGLSLPSETEVRAALGALASHATMLPDRLKPYLDIHIPEALSFELKASAAGGILGGVSVAAPGSETPTRANAEPLRVLIPGMSVTGPVLTGVELWNLQVGEIFGGAALLVRADLNIDQFDVLPLGALLALPSELSAGLPDPRQLTRRLVAEQVTLLVVPAALVAAPVFFDRLGVEYRGIEGVEFGAQLSFPEPSLDLAQARALYEELKGFFTDPDALLAEEAVGGDLDLRLTAGPCYLRVPDYLGGKTFGSRTATTDASAAAGVAHLLNGLKKLRVDELLKTLPQALLDAAGLELSTAQGAPRGLEVYLADAVEAGPLARLGATVDVRTRTGDDVEVAFSADGSVGGLLTLHLDGSAGNSPPVGGGTAVALRFADPAARVVMPGPLWTPQVFTVEWWMYPTALRDYNQFVSAAAKWGSFVFHSTANGAVYCGTDGSTRLTPAEVPPGTVQLNTWQHFAFTYANGHAVLYRNGVKIAEKMGMAAPAPWTGMRLGMPEGGTQPDGLVAELRVWNTYRFPASIQASMGRRLTGREVGLVAYWPGDDGAGTVVRDRGPSGLDGAASGTTWAAVRAGTALPPAPVVEAGADAGAPVRMTGNSSLRIGDRTVFRGGVAIQPDRASVAGTLDLFPDNPMLMVRGNLAGALDERRFCLDGNAVVDAGGIRLASGAISVQDGTVRVGGKWLDMFDTSLTLDTAAGRTVLTGTVRGERSIDVQMGQVYLPAVGGGHPVRVADGFRFRGVVTFTLNVTIDEAKGFAATGSITFSANGQPMYVPVSLSAAPTSSQKLDQLLESAVQSVATAVFTNLYHDADGWAQGVKKKLIDWYGMAWEQTASVFTSVYQKSPTQIAQILDTARYSTEEIGRVLATFTDPATDRVAALLHLLRPTGFSAVKVANIICGGLRETMPTDPYGLVGYLTQRMRGAYGAVEMARVARAFDLHYDPAIRVLWLAGRYAPTDLARAAKQVHEMGYERTAAVFKKLEFSANETFAALHSVFQVRPEDLARFLSSIGYAMHELNQILRSIGLREI